MSGGRISASSFSTCSRRRASSLACRSSSYSCMRVSTRGRPSLPTEPRSDASRAATCLATKMGLNVQSCSSRCSFSRFSRAAVSACVSGFTYSRSSGLRASPRFTDRARFVMAGVCVQPSSARTFSAVSPSRCWRVCAAAYNRSKRCAELRASCAFLVMAGLKVDRGSGAFCRSSCRACRARADS